MTPAYIIDGNILNIVFLDTVKSYNVTSDTCPNWNKIIAKLDAEDFDGLEELISPKNTVEKFVENISGVTVDDNGVKYNGELVNNYITKKIIEFVKNEHPSKPLIRFFEKLMSNPSMRAVEQLYQFLEHGKMPICKDGDFIAYKSVTPNFKDWWTGTIDNSIGAKPSMPRNQVADNPDKGCDQGLHAGDMSYAAGYCNTEGRHLILVKINPANVVSIPKDCECRKLRCCEYEVVGEFEGPLDNHYTEEYNNCCEDDDDEEDCEDCCDQPSCCKPERDERGRFKKKS